MYIRTYVHGRSVDTKLAEIHEKMSDLLENIQNVSLLRGSCKLLQAHKKCVMKMKNEKNDCHVKNFF